ncbi:hypothetical protein [Bacillus toyonensis]|uniref:hypothetical protein n=1 Tax=Bacillus toyonensis TaxID=155322 RepID=UPI002E1EF231|nr:hypothetical protein [Bacillus toyonensis]
MVLWNFWTFYHYDCCYILDRWFSLWILTNTIIVDISEMILSGEYKDIDTRQVVKHGQYEKVRIHKIDAS